ncbi:stage II sporulation protein M [Longirhabdus pacifica]|uniref:stage II sporulation protein M n=1 Tax=Longirhabdus pacifica TaxID=2305227 RepID=UPI001009033D|nr:stage II sporulation protein M [Longirhabdus pacifica]
MQLLKQLKQIWTSQMPITIFICVLFLMGAIFGALMVQSLSLEQENALMSDFATFMQNVLTGEAATGYSPSFMHVFSSHITWIVLIYVLGISVIGFPLIFIVNFLKGILVGFSFGFLMEQLSWKGIAFALVTVIPQNLVVIPIIILGSVLAVTFSLSLFRSLVMNRKSSPSQPLLLYSMTYLLFASCLFVVALLEVFLTPVLTEWISVMIKS